LIFSRRVVLPALSRPRRRIEYSILSQQVLSRCSGMRSRKGDGQGGEEGEKVKGEHRGRETGGGGNEPSLLVA
jgi:hypothetical protein